MSTPLERLRALVEQHLKNSDDMSDEEAAAALLTLHQWADENPDKVRELQGMVDSLNGNSGGKV